MRHPGRLAALAAAVLLLGACGGTEDDPVDETPVQEPSTDPAEEPAGEPADQPADEPVDGDQAAGSDPLLGPEIQIAMADLLERADVAQEDVEIRVTELVTWPDASLGCPNPDEMYTQALVEGHRIVLVANDDEYHYHGASGEDPAYCAEPTPPAE